MLSHLYIKDFAIVPSLELDFHSGFTVITGETGAGKSILVDALGLLLGKRSDSSWVRQGSSQAQLTAEFTLEDNPHASHWLTEAGLESDEQCLLRRTISSSGRSRAWINGSPVTVQQLAELGNLMVEIHGQNEHVRLTTPSQQFQLLDGSGDYKDQLSSVKTCFEQWRELHNEFERLEQQSGLSPSDLDYLKFQLSELETLSISASKVAKLEQEHRKLAQGGALIEALDSSAQLLDSEESGIQKQLQDIISRLQPYLELDPDIKEASSVLTEATINCQEALAVIRQSLGNSDLSPERLAQASEQLSELADLARKHRVPMEDLEQVRDQFRERLANSENFESRREDMQKRCDSALASYREATRDLTKCRTRQAQTLSGAVSSLMEELGMPGGVLDIQIKNDPQARPSYNGDDLIALMVSANPGVEPGPLAKIASGGELSRISLAIKVASSSRQLVKTQIFDEVDAGIGGDTANAVGQMMQKLSRGSQSLCVTHLAQVAVCADHQVRVSKQATENETLVSSVILCQEDRVEEITRMLGGRISEQGKQHAREMLESARSD
jgi:DNA repair protein RecN (Recombination protein N)